MTVKLNSHIGFKDNAKEAIEFYKFVFGGEIVMSTFEEFADRMPVNEEEKHKVMHAYLKGDNGIELMLADTPAAMEFQEGSRIVLTLNGDDDTILRGYWDKLSASGKITMPLEKAPWGDTFGMLVDKFGVTWMVDIGLSQ